MKIYPNSLIDKEMQICTKLRGHSSAIRFAKIKTYVKAMGNRLSYLLLVGIQIDIILKEGNWGISDKITYAFILSSDNPKSNDLP